MSMLKHLSVLLVLKTNMFGFYFKSMFRRIVSLTFSIIAGPVSLSAILIHPVSPYFFQLKDFLHVDKGQKATIYTNSGGLLICLATQKCIYFKSNCICNHGCVSLSTFIFSFHFHSHVIVT